MADVVPVVAGIKYAQLQLIIIGSVMKEPFHGKDDGGVRLSQSD
ncbi:MAG: hypothetical protein QGF12_03965 [SAR202 cluster bacterium]|jgi:hypothetical protein|nr:hypothetical protein [SAR202 cluster bacterium]